MFCGDSLDPLVGDCAVELGLFVDGIAFSQTTHALDVDHALDGDCGFLTLENVES